MDRGEANVVGGARSRIEKLRDSRKTLTDVALRAFIKNPPSKQIDIPDVATPGLSARVTSSGRITWSLRLRVAGEGGQSLRGHKAKGQQYRLTLGSYPTVSIKEARAAAAAKLEQAENGENPVRALAQSAVARHENIGNLIDAFLSEYVAPNLRSYPNAKSMLYRHIVPEWGRYPSSIIQERDVAVLLDKVAKGEIDPKTDKRVPKPGAAVETRKWGTALFAWAVRTGHAHQNPFEKSKNPVRPKPRQRFLEIREARAVWRAAFDLDRPWRDIIQLLMLTGCRHREIAHARWMWLDRASARLVVPASEYKTDRPFLVALSQNALQILDASPKWNQGDCIFSTTGGTEPVWAIPRKIMDDLHAAAEKKLKRKIEHFTVHDLRRTVRTHLARLKVPEIVGELVLGHAIRGVSATYNIYDFETEKREALNKWATELVGAEE